MKIKTKILLTALIVTMLCLVFALGVNASTASYSWGATEPTLQTVNGMSEKNLLDKTSVVILKKGDDSFVKYPSYYVTVNQEQFAFDFTELNTQSGESFDATSVYAIQIPNGVTKLANGPFGSSTKGGGHQAINVERVELADTIATINQSGEIGAFKYNPKIQCIILSGNVTTYPAYFAYTCDSLKEVWVKAGNGGVAPTTYSTACFSKCPLMEEIHIDLSKATTIAADAFNFKSKSTDVPTLNSGMQWYDLDGNQKINLSKVTTIGSYAFCASNIGAFDVTWNPNMTSIGTKAFMAASFTEVDFAFNNVCTLGDRAFRNNNITRASLTNVSTVGYSFFQISSLQEVSIGPGCAIGQYTFSGCSNLKTIKMDKGTTFSGANQFTSVNSKVIIYTNGTKAEAQALVSALDTATGNTIITGIPDASYVEYDANASLTGPNVVYGVAECVMFASGGHDFSDTGAVIVYENGFEQEGKKTQYCASCSASTVVTVPKIFTALGYSYCEEDGSYSMMGGYDIDKEALATYNAYSGKDKLAYGVIVANPSYGGSEEIHVGANNCLDNAAYQMQTDDETYTRFAFTIEGFTAAKLDTSLVISLYTVDDGTMKFAQKTYTKDSPYIKNVSTSLGGTLGVITLEKLIEVDTKPSDLVYTPSGNESTVAGYGEGSVVYTPEGGVLTATYQLFWGDDDGILENYTAIDEEVVSSTQASITLNVGENIYIPMGVTQLYLVCDDGETTETVSSCKISSDKQTASKQPTLIFASVSDVHVNYTEGANFWTNALNEYQKAGVSYVIISGDTTSDGSQYATYKTATEASNFTGLIFTSIGNHEQTTKGRSAIFDSAIYDGATKTWIALQDAEDYFEDTYAGDLNVSVKWADFEGSDNTYYYTAIIENNVYLFMDQMLSSTGNSANQDNFSETELDWLENYLNMYSGTHTVDQTFAYTTYNLNIVEHALIKNFSAGDKFNGSYSQPIIVKDAYANNTRFANLLKTYTEAIFMSGHTHLGFGTSVDFLDRLYDANGSLTSTPVARSIHNSSIAQARWYNGSSIVYKETYESGSEGYLCKVYSNYILYEAHVFKEYTPGSTSYDASLFCNKVMANANFILPVMVNDHETVHNHIAGDPEVLEATLTTEGYVTVRCGICNEIISHTVTPVVKLEKPTALASLSGDATKASPVLISSLTDWQAFVAWIKDASSTITVPSDMNISATSGQPGFGLYFKQTADFTVTAEADCFTNAKGVFAGNYDGNGHTITLDVPVTSNALTDPAVFPILTGSMYNLKVDGSFRLQIPLTNESVYFQGIGSGAVLENCIFSFDLYGYTTDCAFTPKVGQNAIIRGIYISGQYLSRSGSAQERAALVTSAGTGTTFANVYTYITKGSIKSGTNITKLSSTQIADAITTLNTAMEAVNDGNTLIAMTYDTTVGFAQN